MDREKALNKLEKSQRDQMRLVAEIDSIRKEKNVLQKKLDHSDHQVVCVHVSVLFDVNCHAIVVFTIHSCIHNILVNFIIHCNE